MRTKSLLALAALAGLLLMAGCNLNKVSINDRIDMFMDDVNGDWSNLYTHLHVDVVDRNGAKALSYWDATPFAPSAYAPTLGLTSRVKAGNNVSADFVNGDGGESVTFEMKEEEKDDWYIRRITFAIDTVANVD